MIKKEKEEDTKEVGELRKKDQEDKKENIKAEKYEVEKEVKKEEKMNWRNKCRKNQEEEISEGEMNRED